MPAIHALISDESYEQISEERRKGLDDFLSLAGVQRSSKASKAELASIRLELRFSKSKGFGLFTRLPIKESIDLFEEQSLLLIRFDGAHVDQSKMEHYLERMTPKARNSLNALTARRQSARHPLSHDVRVYFNNCVCGHGTLCKLNA